MSNFRIKILIVDDDLVNLNVLEKLLKKHGYETYTAQNGKEALDVLGEHGDIEVIILDRIMPVMDGLEFMKVLKRNEDYSPIPVIMQTSADKQDELSQGLASGVYYYLVKPFTEDVLMSVVKGALHDYMQYRHALEMLEKEHKVHHLLKEAVFEYQSVDEALNIAFVIASILPNKERAIYSLQELLVNAVEHGNLGIGCEEKKTYVLNGNLKDEVERRLQLSENKNKKVRLVFKDLEDRIEIIIQDEGSGFDWKKYINVSPDRFTDPSGRGIAMAYLSGVFNIDYQGNGNTVVCTVIK